MFSSRDVPSLNKILFLYLISGLLLGVGFVFPYLWILAIFGIAGFFQAVTLSSRFWVLVLGGLVAWTTKMLFASISIWTAYPAVIFNLTPGKSEMIAIGFSWVVCALMVGLSGGFFALINSFIYRNFSRRFFILAIPFFWLLLEVTGAYLFSIFTYGEGGTINGVYSLGYVGYLLGEHFWLLQLARFGGVFILTLVIVLSGAWLWHVVSSRGLIKHKQIVFGVMFLIWGSTFFVGQKILIEAGNTRVAIIDTDFGSQDFMLRTDRDIYHEAQIREALTVALNEEVDYVVMSEYSRYLNARLSPVASYISFRFQNADTNAIVVDAGRTPLLGSNVTLRATIYDGVAKTAYGVDKQYLVPQGEYMPFISSLGISLLGSKATAKKIDQDLNYLQGPLSSQKDLPNNVPGILFCFASADPLGVWKLVRERELPFIAHPISHAWFKNPVSLWHQLDTMIKIQAVWNNVPIVSAGNKVAGALYTRNGLKLEPEVFASGESWKVKLVSF